MQHPGTISRSFVWLAFGIIAAAGQTRTPGPYLTRQADAGRAVYLSHCASCHLPELGGRNEAPELAGPNFIRAWGARTTSDLFAFIRSTMPPGDRGNLGDENYVNLVAFLLSANGARAGSQPLTAADRVMLGPVATGAMPPALRKTLASTTADIPVAQQTSRPMGLLVTGQVKNYVPVTDEMLRNPDPGDWLMIRRNYQAHSYSPLDSITTANVKDLRLEWVWAMNDGGANEPTPIVHNGIIYLANTSNTVQALDGRTGDLIWENRIGPESTRAYGATRSLGIYEDKVFIATTDAQLYALDARTGKIVWQTGIADPKKGLQQHQRTARDPRQSSPGSHGLRAVPARGLLHQRLRRGHRQAALEVPDRGARRRSRAATPGARFRT